MALIIRLINHIKADTVAQLIEKRHIRIMACPYSIEIVFFDHHKIRERPFVIHYRSGHRI